MKYTIYDLIPTVIHLKMYEKAHLTFRNFASFYLFEHVLTIPTSPTDFYLDILFLMLQSMITLLLLLTFK